MIAISRLICSRLVRVGKPYFISEVRSRAFLFLGMLLALLLAISALDVVNSYVARDFMTAITERSSGRYYLMALEYLGVFAASTTVGALARYTELRLGLHWR